jgi:hypothetical protein
MITYEDGWQPVRVRRTHGPTFRSNEEVDKILSSILPGKPYQHDYVDIIVARRRGCNSSVFYVVDVRSLHLESGDDYITVCEHDILAD